MIKSRKYAVSLFLSVLAIVVEATSLSPDGSCGPQSKGNYTCLPGNCCSKWGFCGDAAEFCGTGCQPGFGRCDPNAASTNLSPDGSCGPTSKGNYTCAPGNCCSKHGFCGNTEEFCGDGCKQGFGNCNTNLTVVGTTNVVSVVQYVKEHDYTEYRDTRVAAGSMISTCRKPNQIALTFNSGPSEMTSGILDILDKQKVKATFFVQGQFIQPAQARKDVIRRAFNSDHQIGTIGYSRADFTGLSENDANFQIQETNRLVREVTGKTPRYMRLPTYFTNKETLEYIKRNKMVIAQWNLDSQDWEKGADESKLVSRYRQLMANSSRPESIIAVHHDIQPSTTRALEEIIRILKSKEMQFVTISECAGDSMDGAYQ